MKSVTRQLILLAGGTNVLVDGHTFSWSAVAEPRFSEMSEILWDDFRGRVSLVKNVYASPRILAEMHRGEVERFFELKRDLDPHCILCNSFLERVFPDHSRVAGCRP